MEAVQLHAAAKEEATVAQVALGRLQTVAVQLAALADEAATAAEEEATAAKEEATAAKEEAKAALALANKNWNRLYIETIASNQATCAGFRAQLMLSSHALKKEQSATISAQLDTHELRADLKLCNCGK